MNVEQALFNLVKKRPVFNSSGLLDIPVFADKKIPTDQLIVNKVFQITGQVDVYNGELVTKGGNTITTREQLLKMIEMLDDEQVQNVLMHVAQLIGKKEHTPEKSLH
ncbi:hypothetical protein SAMN04487897_12544 [Paenibacillus sp. yr247]|uniref:hypothetical protein n=1 Tax=Paenibacillus sp. yr247 TaxID=1761880 RepID=UPI000881617C|nr:hypothetical protein [Paenibacillus sp. yr247]SDO87815.1 hypothetical protein SAMN04487897_12544 [Paenibacillus sp. yr247]